ncbi:hypothetical protein BD410DRAFT_781511 [Rickenella mellea]|uniref:Copper-fist domain-containing protein n=1 Tax=Rickenella mellea TaxID=50990 RepID=A0A4Y7QPC9_9AGAM|nr:hypothetical protein BD410DRAFT_781511 [Rickenella mellea]
MVFVNSKKYACESCIKGHRSSSCHHNDRPLFEIKKKGRPVSQCEKCREARSTRRIHAKCTCEGEKAEQAALAAGSSAPKKGKRFIPTIPTLPNGLKDALEKPETVPLVNPRQRVDSLLNPCHCKSVWDCRCKPQRSFEAGSSSTSSSEVFSDGLSALAHVAACCAPVEPTPPLSLSRPPPIASSNRGRNRINCPHGHSNNSSKAAKTTSKKAKTVITVPALRPLLASPPSGDAGRHEQPIFPAPSASSAAFGYSSTDHCGCGQRCLCPGCTLHQGGESSNPGEPDAHVGCTHECATCVDHEGGVELPGQKASSTFIDQFFARAATLPSPPSSRTASLDPMNVTVYPRSLFVDDAARVERGPAFGLVNLPKLECCGGQCSCPEGGCSCEEECGGCCVEETGPTPNVQSPTTATSFARKIATPPRGSCCS